jgi:hypothetical protein
LRVKEGDDDKVLAKKAEQLREKEPGSVHVVVSGRKVICTLATDQLPALKANKGTTCDHGLGVACAVR